VGDGGRGRGREAEGGAGERGGQWGGGAARPARVKGMDFWGRENRKNNDSLV